MNELGLSTDLSIEWFDATQSLPYTIARVSDKTARQWVANLYAAVRRSYLPDSAIVESATRNSISDSVVIASKLPDPGSVMAGDFGEILAYIYHATVERSVVPLGPKKWRLKQDRLKPAPYSDVVMFCLPTWPTPSDRDAILCSEVKTKSTDTSFDPVNAAIDGSRLDRTSRLARTLVWLRERATTENLGSIGLAHLNRFIDATEHPPAARRYMAVVVICSSLIAEELRDIEIPNDCSLIVLEIPNLKDTYTAVFEAAKNSSIART
jgi:hypothetical protein